MLCCWLGIGCSNLTKEQGFQSTYDKLTYLQNATKVFYGLSGEDTKNTFESYLNTASASVLAQLQIGSVLVTRSNQGYAKILVQEVISQGFTFQYVIYDHSYSLVAQGLATLIKDGNELALSTKIKLTMEEDEGEIEETNSGNIVIIIH